MQEGTRESGILEVESNWRRRDDRVQPVVEEEKDQAQFYNHYENELLPGKQHFHTLLLGRSFFLRKFLFLSK